jgi:cold shock CspA family protein
VEEVLIREDYVARRISWLANNEIRRSLTLCQIVIQSPHLSIDDLLATYAAQKTRIISVSYPKFMRALILGDYDAYSTDDNSFVSNVFAPPEDFVTTPLLKLSILKLLIDKAGNEAGASSYLSIANLRSYLDAMGVSAEVVDEAVRALLEFRLVEPYDASDDEVHSEQRIAIAHSGRMHFEMATTDLTYIVEMALATPIRLGQVVDELRNLIKEKKRQDIAETLAKVFVTFCLNEDAVFARVPADGLYAGQRQMREELKKRWVDKASDAQSIRGHLGVSLPDPKVSGLSHVKAKVIWFDPAKGYGFVDCGLEADALIGRRTLEAAQMPTVATGDILICDVAPGIAGRFQVIQVYSVEKPLPAAKQLNYVEGEIVFVNMEKRFAFAEVETLSDDIYIPARTLADAGIETIFAGTKVQMVIEPGRFGRYTCALIEVLDEPDVDALSIQ